MEYPEREQREHMLRQLVGLETSFFFEVRGERAELLPDRRGTDPTRTMAVHYVKFVLPKESERLLRSGEGPAVLGVDHPRYQARSELPLATLRSLREDF